MRGWRTPRGEGRPLSAAGIAEPPMIEMKDAVTAAAQNSSGAVSLEGVRLALVSDTYLPQLNGVARTLERLVAAVEGRGGAVEVFTTTDPGADSATGVQRFASVPFWGYPQLRLAVPDPAPLCEALRRWGATLVHAATPFGMGLAARRAARRCDLPFVTSYHTHFTAYAHHYQLGLLSRPGWSFLRWFHNSGLRTFCPTHAVASELEGRGFQRTALWGRGVDCTTFSPGWRALEARREAGVRDADLLVLYVGRVAREKGLDDLLDAMRLLRALPDAPRSQLLVVGDGPDLDRCRARAGDNVRFLGRRTGQELSRLYASADLFVFPSTTDTFGNVTLEAMASGIPVIAADSPVNRELVAPGSGSWYSPGDPQALASHIARWGRDPAPRRSAGLRGREVASTRTWDRIFDQLFREYLHVALAPRRSA